MMENKIKKINKDGIFQELNDDKLLEISAGDSFMDVIVANFTNIIKFIVEPLK